MSRQYEKRDQAFEEWFQNVYQFSKSYSMDNDPDALREAFNAGWAARKQAQYEAMTAHS